MDERKEPTLDASAPASAPTPAPRPGRARRWLRGLALALVLVLLLVAGLLGSAWWWAGQSDSLGRTLARVASWMPADQKLEAEGVEGSLREGGRIEWLRWTSPALQVEIRQADIAWRLQPLLQRELRFGRIGMRELVLRSTPQPANDTPTTPLESLQLPMRLDVPVRIDRLVWEGPPSTEVHDLQGHYRYDGQEHRLEVQSLRYAQGRYTAELQLQAQAPMALEAKVRGTLQAPLPQQAERSVQVEADAHLQGTLAGEAARLELKAHARTTPAPTDAPSDHAANRAMAADVQAILHPWRPQPVEQANAALQRLDLALFWPEGPRTEVSGEVHAGPDGPGWKLQAQLTNALAGPWDRQALPVHELQAQAQFDGDHTWVVERARIATAASGGGHLQAQGHFDTRSQALEGEVQLVQLNPAQLHTGLDAAPLNGRLQARSDAEHTVQFVLNLQAAAARSPQRWRLGAARAEGEWKAPHLQVRNLVIDALQARLHTPQLQFNTDTQQLQSRLQLQMPGAQLQADLNAAPTQGHGQLDLRLAEGETWSRWLASLPGLDDPLGGAQLHGQADARLQWRGGWQALQQRLQNPATALQASGLQLTASLQSAALQWRPAAGDAIDLQQLRWQAQGSPEQLTMELDTQLRTAAQRLQLSTALSGGLLLSDGAAPLDWQARITRLQGGWNGQGDANALWQFQLPSAITASQRTSGNPVRSTRVQLSAGSVQLHPPGNPATPAQLAWEPVLLRQTGNGSWAVQSRGRLQGLPLAWVDALSPNPQQALLSNAGIGGDLVVQGTWDIDSTGRALRADVLLERASGDIRLLVDDADAAPVTVVRSTGASEVNAETQQVRSRAAMGARGMRARLQDLRLQIRAQGTELQATLRMQSERAGNLQADVRSQFRSTRDGFSWPENAPLSGKITANMPNIGIWALFAPPGWRVTGTLQADVALGGTRSAPQWQGSVQAEQLSILSLLDGIDLKNGRLRAQLAGTRLDITDLYLEGGEGSNTRILGQSGNLTQAPKDGGTLTGTGFVEYDPQAPAGSSGIRMDIRAVAQRLQVLVRADRQLSVSGNLHAGMSDGQIRLDGDLRIDRAAILLADSSAPSLDADVHVTSAASRQAAQEKAAQEARRAESAGAVQAARPPEINVRLNLGDDFALQGYGITTRLQGELQIRNGPRITGEIHTVNGRYRAWGQSLDVEQGTIRFNGPYANPAIDIVAIRPNIEVRAGVKVTGSANNPRVALFSEPDMSDAEILSWVVMGRSAAAGGAEAALLQQAALALLSGGGGTGNFAGQLGLDEIGLRGPSDDGEEGAAVTLGKRLSKDFYVAYEQSLNGAMGTLYIFYDLSRRLTLRGQTGEQSAVDLIYTRRTD